MKALCLGTNTIVFVLFFGLALIDALRAGPWWRVAFWTVIGSLFLWADRRAKTS